MVEARRAELDVGGTLIDFGTADQLKYTVAGWGNSWGERKVDSDGTTYSETRGRSLPVRLFLYREAGLPRQIALRVRARGAPRPVGLMVGEDMAGPFRVGSSWTTLTFALESIRPGPLEIVIVPQGPSRDGGLDVDWLWLGRTRDGALPQVAPRVGPLTFGDGTRRALLAPTPRTYTFYLEVPRGGSLVFDYGGAAGTRFLVRTRADRGPGARVLFEAMAEPGRWREAVVDLNSLAGRAIKLELITQDAISAGWGEPEIMVPRETPSAAPLPARKPARNVILLVIDTVRADVFRSFNPKSACPHAVLRPAGRAVHRLHQRLRQRELDQTVGGDHPVGSLSHHARHQGRQRRAQLGRPSAVRTPAEEVLFHGGLHRQRLLQRQVRFQARAGTPIPTTSVRTSHRRPIASSATLWPG